jgi:hypothetical protein
MIAGLKVQLVFAGNPEYAKVTCPENPPAPVTSMGADTVWPALTANVMLPLLPRAGANAVLTTRLSVVTARPEKEAIGAKKPSPEG